MKTTLFHITRYVTLAFVVMAGLVGCNLPADQATPSSELDVTQAYQTVEARMTQVLALTASPTPPPPTSTANTSPSPTVTPATTTPRPSPTTILVTAPATGCDVAAPGNPIDVTIPDDTTMLPNQQFTKVWRLQNTGKCTWTKSYAVIFFSGEQMSAAASIPLAGDVAPGQTVDLTVDMVAPASPGSYQGNWKLRNAGNVLFGIGPNGSAPFWVRILVVATASVTPTVTATRPTATATQAYTPTATPVIQASGSVNLNPNDSVDLDTIQVNSGAGHDLTYEINPGGQHLLAPKNNAIIGVYGNTQPSPANCQSAPMTSTAIILENTPAISYLCYRTDQGRLGYSRFTGFNAGTGIVSMDLVTWANP